MNWDSTVYSVNRIYCYCLQPEFQIWSNWSTLISILWVGNQRNSEKSVILWQPYSKYDYNAFVEKYWPSTQTLLTKKQVVFGRQIKPVITDFPVDYWITGKHSFEYNSLYLQRITTKFGEVNLMVENFVMQMLLPWKSITIATRYCYCYYYCYISFCFRTNHNYTPCIKTVRSKYFTRLKLGYQSNNEMSPLFWAPGALV